MSNGAAIASCIAAHSQKTCDQSSGKEGRSPRRFALTVSAKQSGHAPEAERAFFAEVDRARRELAERLSRPTLTKDAAVSLAVGWFLRGLEGADDWRKPKREVIGPAGSWSPKGSDSFVSDA